MRQLTAVGKALPGYEFIKVADQGTYINNSIGEVKNTLLIGIFLAVFVLYIFLRRIGTTLVISVAIPVSIIATFNLMYFSHLTLNIMTLGGLALGAGMLVDNAIVVLENITRKREEGMSSEGSSDYRNRTGRRSNNSLNSYNNCGLSAYCLSSWSIQRNVQGPGMDSGICSYFIAVRCHACDTDAGFNFLFRQKQKRKISTPLNSAGTQIF